MEQKLNLVNASGGKIQHYGKDFFLNMPLAYRVLTSIWKRMGAGRRGFGENLAGARLKITMLFECHHQKKLLEIYI